MVSLLLDVFVLLVAYGITVGIAFALVFFTYATAPRWMARNGEPHPRFLFLNALIWTLSAAIGGALIAYLVLGHTLVIGIFFACIIFAVIVYVASQAIGKTTLAYEIAVGICAFAGALLGCILVRFFHLHLSL
ncbi:MAG TPA: hypothetical protein VGB94_06480 [Acidobacteriaceae bacterium]